MKRPEHVMSPLGTHAGTPDTSWERHEAVLERFRIVLRRLGRRETSWKRLEPSWTRLQAFAFHVEVPCRPVDTSWKRLEALWNRLRTCKKIDFAAYIY